MNFYPRSPCGERPAREPVHDVEGQISIHALLAESDAVIAVCEAWVKDFYPRSPCGERRTSKVELAAESLISIHALLAESDATLTLW